MIDYDIVGYGESSIDDVWLLSAGLVLGGKGRTRGRDRLGGGQVATALVAAARLGAPETAFLGPLGDDPIGGEISCGLMKEGIDVLAPRVGVSRLALVLVGADGERTIVEDGRSAGPPAGLPSTRALHVDGTQREAVALCEEARARGVLISIDVDLDVDPGRARALAALADLCVVAEGALERGLRPREGAFVVETLGARGVRWNDTIVPSFEVDVVDTTACGDTLRGALLVAWLEGRRGVEALRFANAAAALKCRDLGRRGCPHRAEVDALLGC